MNDSEQEYNQPQKTDRAISRKPLIAILVVSILPILAAYTIFFTGLGVPSETKNKGFLIKPAINLNAINSEQLEQKLELWKTDIKWRIVIPLSEVCDQSCAENMYVTRQVHTRLGEKSVRVDRIAFNVSGNTTNAYYETIKQDHPDLEIINIDKDAWIKWISQTNVPHNNTDGHNYLLLNQENFAMMWYDNSIHGNDLLKDIKHALKYSVDFQK